MAWNCKMCGKRVDDSEKYCSYCGSTQNPENELDEEEEYDPDEEELEDEEFKKLKSETDKLLSQVILCLRIIGILILFVEIGYLILSWLQGEFFLL